MADRSEERSAEYNRLLNKLTHEQQREYHREVGKALAERDEAEEEAAYRRGRTDAARAILEKMPRCDDRCARPARWRSIIGSWLGCEEHTNSLHRVTYVSWLPALELAERMAGES